MSAQPVAADSWAVESVQSGFASLNGVSCPTRSYCTVTGAAPSTSGAAIGTTNGGATWSAETLPAQTRPLGGVSCPTASECIALTGGALKTTNWGATWTPETFTSEFTGYGVACPTSSFCVSGGEVGTVTSAQFEGIDSSSDGGSNWTAAYQTGSGLAGSAAKAVTCPSSTDCRVVGEDGNNMGVVIEVVPRVVEVRRWSPA